MFATFSSAVIGAFAFGVLIASPALSEELAAPTGEIVLTVSGDISVTNAPEGAVFDREMLAKLETAELQTSTIWTEGVHVFSGISLSRLAEELGVTGGTFKMTAINDYMVEVPVSDAVKGGPILAYAMDGVTMSVRDKGPVWLIYPFDDNEDYRSEVYYSRSIWQLNRIEVVN